MGGWEHWGVSVVLCMLKGAGREGKGDWLHACLSGRYMTWVLSVLRMLVVNNCRKRQQWGQECNGFWLRTRKPYAYSEVALQRKLSAIQYVSLISPRPSPPPCVSHTLHAQWLWCRFKLPFNPVMPHNPSPPPLSAVIPLPCLMEPHLPSVSVCLFSHGGLFRLISALGCVMWLWALYTPKPYRLFSLTSYPCKVTPVLLCTGKPGKEAIFTPDRCLHNIVCKVLFT